MRENSPFCGIYNFSSNYLSGPSYQFETRTPAIAITWVRTQRTAEPSQHEIIRAM
jgi:hypothetical protein